MTPAIVASQMVPTPRVPDSLLVSALDARTGSFGGCWGQFDTATVLTPFFPGVHFLAATCIREHGNPTSAMVGRDSAGVLYLLGDDLGLQFLLTRHGPDSISPPDRLAWARLLLELSGRTYRQTVYLDSAARLPPAGRRALGKQADNFYTTSFQITGLTVLLPTSTMTYDTEIIQQWQVWRLSREKVLIKEIDSWEGAPVSRFSMPRTADDSTLAAAATALGRDYGVLHAASDMREPDGLRGLFALTPELTGPALALHLDVLFEQQMIWGDQPFIGILKTCTPAVQRFVVTAMVEALPPKPDWSFIPALAGLATSLGLRPAP